MTNRSPHLEQGIKILKATGRERNPCEYCGERVEINNKMVEIAKSSYNGNFSYERFHPLCFFEILVKELPELIEDDVVSYVRKKVILSGLTNDKKQNKN